MNIKKLAFWLLLSGFVALPFVASGKAIANEVEAQTPQNMNLNQLRQDADQLETDVDQTTNKDKRGANYIGIAADTAINDENASLQREMNSTIISKFLVYSNPQANVNLSVRPGVRIVDDPVFTLPITYDFSRPGGVSPYVGGGVSVQTGENSSTDPLAVVGLDLPVTKNITANTALNATFADKTDLRATVGIGYNF